QCGLSAIYGCARARSTPAGHHREVLVRWSIRLLRHDMSDIHVLVLAAGGSTRLGQPKQLVRLGGRPALHIVVSNAVALAGHNVTVVLGAHARELTHLLAHSLASVIVDRHWEEGLASSSRAGLSVLPPACEALILLL